MTFAGRVYDGPLEGEQRVSETPWFYCMAQRSPSVSYASYGPTVPPACFEMDKRFYRWSHPLRAWVFCWDNRESRYAYTG